MKTNFNMLINADYLKKMLVMQEALNAKYNGEDWREKVKMSNVKFAILDEVSELLREIESTWKWWKHEPVYNKQKAIFELIDLIHFGLLALLHRYDLNELIESIDKSMYVGPGQFGCQANVESAQEFFVDSLTSFVAGIDNPYHGKATSVTTLCDLIQAGGELVGLTNAVDIYNAYVMKNHRNHQRVDGGVMVGKYDKTKESDLPIGN